MSQVRVLELELLSEVVVERDESSVMVSKADFEPPKANIFWISGDERRGSLLASSLLCIMGIVESLVGNVGI
jgi:hypothetical protein